MNSDWEVMIGLEVHVELSTESKIFCSCTTQFGGEPNTHCCPVCMGMPGTLPVLNKKVLEYAIKAGLALNCEIERFTRFDRKNYFYPDLPKAYQISQLYRPIAHDGFVEISVGDEKKKIRIHEMHMEEDAGKLIHSAYVNETYPDYNRCGVPLLEIVSEPDFRSPEEVVEYLKKIRSLFTYMGISDCKMQEGSMRADVNLSVRRKGDTVLGTRTEMKNINSIKAIERAIRNEASRQIDVLEGGGKVIQETRHWDDESQESFSMRSKENAQDYRYFPEPDIPPIIVTEEQIEATRRSLPEFMEEKEKRFTVQYGLSDYDAGLLVKTIDEAEFFENTAAAGAEPKAVANWMNVHLTKALKDCKTDFESLTLSPEEFSKLIQYAENGNINRHDGVELLEKMVGSSEITDVEKYISEHDMFVANDESEILESVRQVMADNQDAVESYRNGKEKIIGFLVGQVMKISKGKFNPAVVKETLEKELKNS